MYIDRRIERHQLPYYLKVYNRYTDRPIGYLGNVSESGLMLISNVPLLVGPDFELQLKVPAHEGEIQLINLTGSCLWCQEDTTPGFYDSGFMLLQVPVEYEQLVDALRRYFSFLPMSASA